MLVDLSGVLSADLAKMPFWELKAMDRAIKDKGDNPAPEAITQARINN